MSGMVFFLVLSVFVHGASVSPINPVERSEDIAFSNTPQMYGSWLFEGGFSEASFSGLNPAYKISQGDLLLVQIWGGLDFQAELKVDAQGNVFIPKVGPVRLAGVTNAELNRVLLNAVKRVYKSNVNTYVTLQSTQKVKVFLAGLVSKPGLYEGQSADSLLKFIDQAGGIRESLGGYRQIELKRNLEVIAQFDLYQFISHGNLPLIQLLEGDVIFVGASKGEVSIEGDVSFSGRYEISANNSDLSEILAAVSPTSRATHVTIIEASGLEVNAKQISIAKAAGQTIKAGARIKISSQQRPSSISVEVLGEHDSAREM
ncbi:MAG: polysaccharide export protein, partial [Moraxellaceae bacterium]